jgi:hypothetical protein
MYPEGGLSPGSLVEELGLYAGPAVWGYRDAVVAAADDLGVTVDHDLGLVQIGLQLADVPRWTVGWRIDHGWYLVRRRQLGEPPPVGPTLYRVGSDLLDQLLPEPAVAAHWLHELSNHRLIGTGRAPDISCSSEQLATVLRRLRSFLPQDRPGYSWFDDCPLTAATRAAVQGWSAVSGR